MHEVGNLFLFSSKIMLHYIHVVFEAVFFCCIFCIYYHFHFEFLCTAYIYTEDDVKSLSLPGTYNEKISSLGTSLNGFNRLKSLDLSRNALVTTEVILCSIFKTLKSITVYYKAFFGESQGIHWCFQQEDNWFSQAGKTLWTKHPAYKRNFSPDG